MPHPPARDSNDASGVAPERAREADTDPDRLTPALLAVAQGDEAAFASLYDATSRRVYGLVLRVLRNPSQSEEVTQEIYLEVWRHAGKYDPDRGSPLGWLMTLAHRRAVDRVRSSQAATVRDESYEARTREVHFDTTAEAATAQLEAHRVRQALDRISEVQREAVSLAYLDGYTHREVAARLDLPLGTAKTRIRDGLIRLRDQLGVTP
ncbi:ECF RNA polymerase sigma factor SigK [Janibacter sp. GS2]|uniref:ECF RNA polymerase sigma factor SigK n=1 Tax=Janibacter sp. GS2 TaxID=3442646 RepID=UPI003EBFB545